MVVFLINIFQVVGISGETHCKPLLVDIFLFSVKLEIFQSPQLQEKKKETTKKKIKEDRPF